MTGTELQAALAEHRLRVLLEERLKTEENDAAFARHMCDQAGQLTPYERAVESFGFWNRLRSEHDAIVACLRMLLDAASAEDPVDAFKRYRDASDLAPGEVAEAYGR